MPINCFHKKEEINLDLNYKKDLMETCKYDNLILPLDFYLFFRSKWSPWTFKLFYLFVFTLLALCCDSKFLCPAPFMIQNLSFNWPRSIGKFMVSGYRSIFYLNYPIKKYKEVINSHFFYCRKITMKLSISKNVEDYWRKRSINEKGSMIPINSYSNNLSKQRCYIAGYS